MSFILKKRGHTVEVAENGRQALELLQQRHFDIVLMDVQMPAYVFSTSPNGDSVELKWTDADPLPGPVSYYFVRNQQADGNLAWSWPMWIHRQGN